MDTNLLRFTDVFSHGNRTSVQLAEIRFLRPETSVTRIRKVMCLAPVTNFSTCNRTSSSVIREQNSLLTPPASSLTYLRMTMEKLNRHFVKPPRSLSSADTLHHVKTITGLSLHRKSNHEHDRESLAWDCFLTKFHVIHCELRHLPLTSSTR